MKTAACFLFLLISTTAFPQSKSDTLSAAQTKELLKQLIDSAKFLKTSADEACKCIDSISVTNKDHKTISAEIAACIEKEVTSYQLALKLFSNMPGNKKDEKIYINIDKNSAEYKHYYYEIERRLNDSCTAIREAAAANNKKTAFSTSANTDAVRAYNIGINAMKAENYTDAIIAFENAVKIDAKFAFAWDNIGICSRKLGQYEKALKAYNTSLQIDPQGKTPLQNIPVVYNYMKEYDKAISAYEEMAKIYPDDAETFYGIGNIYTYAKPDMEKALRNMCKAYNLYVEQKSPYRTDAETAISYIFGQMKKAGKEEEFFKILKEYHLSPSK